MKSVCGKMALTVLLVALGSAIVFWGCSKKSPTGSGTTGGRLYIASYPDSATVTLDGATQSGRSPLTLQNVSAAQHVVRCTKGNYYAVDTVVVHAGRTTPDTAFCWIPGEIYATSAPSPAGILFRGFGGYSASGTTPALWYPAPSDTYVVRCSLSTSGYFKAVDTLRIWADSTAKNYVLPPMADSTVVYARDSATGTWQRNGPFNKVDMVEVTIYFAHPLPVDILLKYQIFIDGSLAGSDSGIVPSTWPRVFIDWTNGGHCFPIGNYTHPSSWGVMPHNFPLSNPNWRINSFLGVPVEPGRIRARVRRLSEGHPF